MAFDVVFQTKSTLTMAEEVFEVEKILDMRTRNCCIEFYIKWRGFPDDENTWEKVDNLNCEDKIVEFHENRRRKVQEQLKVKQEDTVKKEDDVPISKNEKVSGYNLFEEHLFITLYLISKGHCQARIRERPRTGQDSWRNR